MEKKCLNKVHLVRYLNDIDVNDLQTEELKSKAHMLINNIFLKYNR